MIIRVSLARQKLYLSDDTGATVGEWSVSTALRGA